MHVEGTMTTPSEITSHPRGTTGDEIEAVYRDQHIRFLRVATAIAGSAEAGQDAVQEALVRALASRKAFRRAGSVEAWLWKIVVNASRNVRRASGLTPHEPGVSDTTDEDPDAAEIRARVASLPERQRHVLFLRYYADLDYAAIAAALGVRRGTVSATLSQAHAALRRTLDEKELA
jgi:RNA polymerase sigma factor (sigma-70 family)